MNQRKIILIYSTNFFQILDCGAYDDYYNDEEELTRCSCYFHEDGTYDGCPCCVLNYRDGESPSGYCGSVSNAIIRSTATVSLQNNEYNH